MNVFVIKTVVKDVSFSTIFLGVIPFVVTDVQRLAILSAFPVIAVWLPSHMYYSQKRPSIAMRGVHCEIHRTREHDTRAVCQLLRRREGASRGPPDRSSPASRRA